MNFQQKSKTIPTCFKSFNENSQFCQKVCQYAEACLGKEVVREPEEEIKRTYNLGKLSFKEMCMKRMELIVEKQRKIEEIKKALS